MEVKAITRHVRISPLKVRDVVREICGLPASQALDILNFTPKKAAYLVGKTLRSGIANAENNHEMSVDKLVIKEAQVGEGPRLKRFSPAARGSAHPIQKRSSHIRIILTDEIALPEKKKKSTTGKAKSTKPKAQAPVTEAAPAQESAPQE